MSFVDGYEATTVHGQDAQNLVEKIIRLRITESIYWKEHCFSVNAETIVDKAVALTSVGGQFGMQKPTEFLCLTLRLLQLQPDKSIISVYLQNEEHKYLTALAAFYIRLTYKSVDVYNYLEPLLLDKRKLRMRDAQGNYYLSYMDEFADTLLRSDRVCEIILPRITKRSVLVEAKDLEERVSPLEEELDLMMEEEDEEDKVDDNAETEETENANDDDFKDKAVDDDGAIKEPGEENSNDERPASSSNEVNVPRRSISPAPQRKSADVDHKNDRHRSRSRSRDRRDSDSRDSYRSSRDYDRSSSYRSRDRDLDSYRSRDSYGDRSYERRGYNDRDDRRDRDRDRDYRRRDYDDDRSYRREESSRRDLDRGDRDRDLDRRRDRDDDTFSRRRSDGEITEPPHEVDEEPLGSTAAEEAEKKKKKYSSKKVNALFKKSKDSGSTSASKDKSGDDGDAGGGSKESMSIEETNKMRLALGLKPLKQ
ncbi:PRP38-domain-containing protein [Rhizoclosmatium globosum]|uniref:Pre-mRNA-splicing factor 38 n=1 Tax=Rhizoclosmatium globosum TaxID=329046 RepID=A0A1Y2BV62_9FUNG|nr:PRP38-domain-containing protein [Rhizoclosmatium globosum]|eukprot:ORY38564.1 PRP38-domain-containing protein [Rhizoclosmatium globosum]